MNRSYLIAIGAVAFVGAIVGGLGIHFLQGQGSGQDPCETPDKGIHANYVLCFGDSTNRVAVDNIDNFTNALCKIGADGRIRYNSLSEKRTEDEPPESITDCTITKAD